MACVEVVVLEAAGWDAVALTYGGGAVGGAEMDGWPESAGEMEGGDCVVLLYSWDVDVLFIGSRLDDRDSLQIKAGGCVWCEDSLWPC